MCESLTYKIHTRADCETTKTQIKTITIIFQWVSIYHFCEIVLYMLIGIILSVFNVMMVSFIGEGNQSTSRKVCKSLTKFIKYTLPQEGVKHTNLHVYR